MDDTNRCVMTVDEKRRTLEIFALSIIPAGAEWTVNNAFINAVHSTIKKR